MHRFYVPQKITGNTASITDAEQLHHMRDVLRLKAGDEVMAFDIEGNEYLCRIEALDRKQAVLAVKSRKPAIQKKMKIVIACAIPKKSRMDDIIDKLTQLGVDTIIPLDTERVVVKLDENNPSAGGRLGRWKKIARSAAEQSQRNTLPCVSPIMNLQEVLNRSQDYKLKLISTLVGESRTIKEALPESGTANVLVLIGPEGDFTAAEIEQAIEAGFIPVSLGDTVLRVETAAIAIASYLKFALMD
jgi:16S rRNA (uracil1498-N3)-methyltransferase